MPQVRVVPEQADRPSAEPVEQVALVALAVFQEHPAPPERQVLPMPASEPQARRALQGRLPSKLYNPEIWRSLDSESN